MRPWSRILTHNFLLLFKYHLDTRSIYFISHIFIYNITCLLLVFKWPNENIKTNHILHILLLGLLYIYRRLLYNRIGECQGENIPISLVLE